MAGERIAVRAIDDELSQRRVVEVGVSTSRLSYSGRVLSLGVDLDCLDSIELDRLGKNGAKYLLATC